MSFSEDEKAIVGRMAHALADMQGELGLPQLVALLAIASHPGMSVNDLGEQIRVPQQTASRLAAILLGRYETASAAPRQPLISQGVNEEDPRKRTLELTPAGDQLVRRLLNLTHNSEGER